MSAKQDQGKSFGVGDIETLLSKAFTPLVLEVTDTSHKHKRHKQALTHGGGHFTVYIVSEEFNKKTALERHRLVFESLFMPREDIHALSIQAKSPSEVGRNQT